MSSLLDEIAGGEVEADAYDALPVSIKAMYSRKAWMWLSDREKADIVTNECMPEVFEE